MHKKIFYSQCAHIPGDASVLRWSAQCDPLCPSIPTAHFSGCTQDLKAVMYLLDALDSVRITSVNTVSSSTRSTLPAKHRHPPSARHCLQAYNNALNMVHITTAITNSTCYFTAGSSPFFSIPPLGPSHMLPYPILIPIDIHPLSSPPNSTIPSTPSTVPSPHHFQPHRNSLPLHHTINTKNRASHKSWNDMQYQPVQPWLPSSSTRGCTEQNGPSHSHKSLSFPRHQESWSKPDPPKTLQPMHLFPLTLNSPTLPASAARYTCSGGGTEVEFPIHTSPSARTRSPAVCSILLTSSSLPNVHVLLATGLQTKA